MKRIATYLAAALTVFAAVSCEKNKPAPTPEPDPLTLEISVGTVTKTTVSFTVTPNLDDSPYLCTVVPYSMIEYINEETIAETLIEEFRKTASDKGYTLDEYLNKGLLKGKYEGTAKGMSPSSKYAVVAWGVNPDAQWASTTETMVATFNTEDIAKSDCTFSFKTTVFFNTVDIEVEPSDLEARWHACVVPKEMLETYMNPDTYNMSLEDFFMIYTQNEISQYLDAGYSEQEILDALFIKGKATLAAKGLNEYCEYSLLIGTFLIDEEGIFFNSEVTQEKFTTEQAVASDLTFEVSVTNVRAMKADIKITPSNNEEKFCWMYGPYNGEDQHTIVDNIVTQWGAWMNMGIMLYTGVQDFPDYSLDGPDKDYYVIAFGYSGGVTTKPAFVTFHSLAGGKPEDCTFETEATNITPYSFEANITSSDETVFYHASAVLSSEYDEAKISGEIEEAIQSLLQMSQMFDPTMTIDKVVASNYYHGKATISGYELEPNTSYTVFAAALDQATGKVVKFHKLKEVSTKALGKIKPSAEVVGVYSGDDENGQVFGNAEQTKGKVITVVKFNVDEAATAAYNAIMDVYDGDDVSAYSDSYLYSQARWYKQTIRKNKPYSFYLTDWNKHELVASWAVDADGTEGAIDRLEFTSTAEQKGNIQELIDLVNKLEAIPDETAPQSACNALAPSEGKNIFKVQKKEEAAKMTVPSMIARPERPAIKKGNMMQLKYVSPFFM